MRKKKKQRPVYKKGRPLKGKKNKELSDDDCIKLEEPFYIWAVEDAKKLEILEMLIKKFGKNAKIIDIVNYYKNKYNISGKVILI